MLSRPRHQIRLPGNAHRIHEMSAAECECDISEMTTRCHVPFRKDMSNISDQWGYQLKAGLIGWMLHQPPNCCNSKQERQLDSNFVEKGEHAKPRLKQLIFKTPLLINLTLRNQHLLWCDHLLEIVQCHEEIGHGKSGMQNWKRENSCHCDTEVNRRLKHRCNRPAQWPLPRKKSLPLSCYCTGWWQRQNIGL